MRLPYCYRTFTAKLGDISRRGNGINFNYPLPPGVAAYFNIPGAIDEAMIYDYLGDRGKRYSREQIASMDINNSNGITYKDATMLSDFIQLAEEMLIDGGAYET